MTEIHGWTSFSNNDTEYSTINTDGDENQITVQYIYSPDSETTNTTKELTEYSMTINRDGSWTKTESYDYTEIYDGADFIQTSTSHALVESSGT